MCACGTDRANGSNYPVTADRLPNQVVGPRRHRLRNGEAEVFGSLVPIAARLSRSGWPRPRVPSLLICPLASSTFETPNSEDARNHCQVLREMSPLDGSTYTRLDQYRKFSMACAVTRNRALFEAA